jgi:succinoglycan biosynthesis protein ExoW
MAYDGRDHEYYIESRLGVRTISVVIPYYQREPGILNRALKSIHSQLIPEGWGVDVIVVDDGSPCSAQDEIRDIRFTEPVRLKVLRQQNKGVAAARNRALDEATPSATLIAFLDSDDLWPPDHLVRAVNAYESGFDFYFTDNRRPGIHESHVRLFCGPNTAQLIADSKQQSGILEIKTDYMVGLTMKEFPAQASTVVYACKLAPQIRFDTRLTAASEDVLFFVALVAKAERVGFDMDSYVDCGNGVNMYFAHLAWDSPNFLAIKADQLVAHRLINKTLKLSPANKEWNDGHVINRRRALTFHLLRNAVKHPARVPKVVVQLLKVDPAVLPSLIIDLPHTIRIACSDVEQSS